MIRRPWQTWLVYGVSLTVAVIALSWLSGKVLELDRAELAAQARSQQDELAGAALWRMDVELSHLLAPEVGRPVTAFHPVLEGEGKGKGASLIASPLLMQPSEYVLLHFEVDETGGWISPQCPPLVHNEFALGNGTTKQNIALSQQRLDRLSAAIQATELLSQLPVELFTYEDTPQLAASYAFNPPPQTYIANANSEEAQELAQQQMQQGPALQQGELQQAPQFAQRAAPNRGGRLSTNDDRTQQSRAASEYNRRFNALQTSAQQSLVSQQRNAFLDAPSTVSLSRTQPFWNDGRLLLVRRVVSGPSQLAQGCWLNWPAIRERLLEEVSDLLPDAQLMPVHADSTAPLNRLLASVPAQLVLSEPVTPEVGLTPMRLALLVSWGCFGVAAVSAGTLLHGVMRLSERRASFVSAVTHELRTPLTTFRMYSEMLAEGMVDPKQQQGYLETLKGEADRLSHLVENVLQYARLEHSQTGWKMTESPALALLDLAADRLETRARQAGLTLKWESDPKLEGVSVLTNLAALEQIVFNLVDNACKYGTPGDPPRLEIRLRRDGDHAEIAVRDFGPGVPADQRRRLFQPFSRTKEVGPAPGVGLGLALCRRLAAQLGARLVFEPCQPGAQFTLRIPNSG